MKLIAWFEELTRADIPIAGGKGANLGEMIRAGIPVPPGFVVTAEAYKQFIEKTGLGEKIREVLSKTNVDNPKQLEEAGETIRKIIRDAKIPDDIREVIIQHYRKLCDKLGDAGVFVAIRSSATAEDLPEASFAGQQDTYLNIHGEDSVVDSVQRCWASLFTNRAIFYREKQKIDHFQVLMSVVVQKMVNSEAAGVMFTIHPITSERDKIVIESSWGLGESVVSGGVTPDRFVVDKNTFKIIDKQISEKKEVMRVRDAETGKTIEVAVPRDKVSTQSLPDNLIIELAKIGKRIEDHYQFPQDIEWAMENEKLYIVQTRAVTAFFKEGKPAKPVEEKVAVPEEILVKGLGASPGIGTGPVRVVLDVKEIDKVNVGDVLVTKMTNPDWVPAMKRAAAIVTDEGGMTCHASIVSRELGTPCIVGARNATEVLKKYEGQLVTVDGSRGTVFLGARKLEAVPVTVPASGVAVAAPMSQPITATKIYVNLSIPEIAEKVVKESQPDGVGLLRAEHLMLSIGAHPRKLIEEGGAEKMINAFAEGIRKVAEAFYPRPVVYRALDFKPDEFLSLPGGEKYEKEAGHVGPNPLIGYRGAFRYRKEPDVFRLECRAIKKVRDEYGLKNVYVMIPFVRNLADLIETKKIMEEEGLKRSPDFKLWIMVEVPNTIFLIDKFIEVGIDGISFGTNDLTMLILGIDRDDASVAEIYDERDPGVLRALAHAIRVCNEHGVTTSICGQAPSVYPEYCEFMVRQGATSMSVNPDAVIATRRLVASVEQKIMLEKALGIKMGGESLEFKPRWEQ
ncbi:phosphoenolpyruvate synthase [Candidatus Bathyarchaeota archaeon]|nr:phosphoenolpyruvate synthase [Candidatus Bathyarchaeota archaeon]